jgi:hypothetical protein
MMNIHKEYDKITIVIRENNIWSTKSYNIDMKGILNETPDDFEGIRMTAYDNFYIHSGQEEFISYNTIAPDGRVIEVNRFIALHKNQGIKRVDGSRG